MISVFQLYRTGNDVPVQNSRLYQRPCFLLVLEFQGYGKIMVTFQAIRRFASISPEHDDVIHQIGGIKSHPGCLVNQGDKKSYTPLSSSILMMKSSPTGKGSEVDMMVKCIRYVNSRMLKATRSYTLPISSRFSSDTEESPTYSGPGAEEIRFSFNRSATRISRLVVTPFLKPEKS